MLAHRESLHTMGNGKLLIHEQLLISAVIIEKFKKPKSSNEVMFQQKKKCLKVTLLCGCIFDLLLSGNLILDMREEKSRGVTITQCIPKVVSKGRRGCQDIDNPILREVYEYINGTPQKNIQDCLEALSGISLVKTDKISKVRKRLLDYLVQQKNVLSVRVKTNKALFCLTKPPTYVYEPVPSAQRESDTLQLCVRNTMLATLPEHLANSDTFEDINGEIDFYGNGDKTSKKLVQHGKKRGLFDHTEAEETYTDSNNTDFGTISPVNKKIIASNRDELDQESLVSEGQVNAMLFLLFCLGPHNAKVLMYYYKGELPKTSKEKIEHMLKMKRKEEKMKALNVLENTIVQICEKDADMAAIYDSCKSILKEIMTYSV